MYVYIYIYIQYIFSGCRHSTDPCVEFMMFLQSIVPKPYQNPSKILPGPFQILPNPSKIVPKSISDATKDFLGTTLDPSSKKVGFCTPKKWPQDAQECPGEIKMKGKSIQISRFFLAFFRCVFQRDFGLIFGGSEPRKLCSRLGEC